MPRLVELDAVASTNTELVARAADPAEPDFSTLVTFDQTAGRGRLGRSWVAPRGSALAVSVLLRPRLPAGEPLALERYGWFALAAGVAMTDAVRSVLPEAASVGFKWPNDVLIDGRKVCGVLAEILGSGDGLVVGAGLNLTMTAEQLPVPTATSLALAGADPAELADRALSGYLAGLRSLVTEYLRLGGDAEASGLLARARECCVTLGRSVRVELPGDAELIGTAIDLDAAGRLQVKRGSDGRVVAVAAGDVTHVR